MRNLRAAIERVVVVVACDLADSNLAGPKTVRTEDATTVAVIVVAAAVAACIGAESAAEVAAGCMKHRAVVDVAAVVQTCSSRDKPWDCSPGKLVQRHLVHRRGSAAGG